MHALSADYLFDRPPRGPCLPRLRLQRFDPGFVQHDSPPTAFTFLRWIVFFLSFSSTIVNPFLDPEIGPSSSSRSPLLISVYGSNKSRSKFSTRSRKRSNVPFIGIKLNYDLTTNNKLFPLIIKNRGGRTPTNFRSFIEEQSFVCAANWRNDGAPR